MPKKYHQLDTGLYVIGPEERGKPTVYGASRAAIISTRLKEVLCRLLNWLGAPGVIKPLQYDDPLTGMVIEIRVGVLFTRLTVDGRDFYFHRLSGRFDGTGQGCL